MIYEEIVVLKIIYQFCEELLTAVLLIIY